ncbi:hypothetical protein [Companilactobacillus furfuricola]|uniref:hypothetical protein n=1 Tax=Companilactobacillus furfuricola TaxID=1462575 RepID=UPI000F7A4FD7|nr:hypothetical protein [Companilactobacillus furfuricola]
MLKKLSITTAVLAGLLLAGCSNTQTSSSTQSKDNTEQMKSTKSNASDSNANSSNQTKSAKDTESDDETTTNAKSTNQSGSQSDASAADTNSSAKSNQKTDASDKSSTQADATQSNANVINSASDATTFLGDKLASTYDKATTQYVANGKITWNNIEGYQVNVYTKNSNSPVGSYLVPANGQYFQIW